MKAPEGQQQQRLRELARPLVGQPPAAAAPSWWPKGSAPTNTAAATC